MCLQPWYIYTMEYYSAIKKNTFESLLMRQMKLEPIIQSEVSQKEKHQYSGGGGLVTQSCPILCDPISGSPPGSDLLPNDYHFFKHLDDFLQGKCFHNQQEAENAFQEFLKP